MSRCKIYQEIYASQTGGDDSEAGTEDPRFDARPLEAALKLHPLAACARRGHEPGARRVALIIPTQMGALVRILIDYFDAPETGRVRCSAAQLGARGCWRCSACISCCADRQLRQDAAAQPRCSCRYCCPQSAHPDLRARSGACLSSVV
ncbi:MAG: hypothetical protein ACLUN5_16520 [Oscillospiraceae bacterium]